MVLCVYTVPVTVIGVERERDLLYFDEEMSEKLVVSVVVCIKKIEQNFRQSLYTHKLLWPDRDNVERMLLFPTWITFFGAQIIRVRRLPAKDFVWMSLTQNMRHWHKVDGLTLL